MNVNTKENHMRYINNVIVLRELLQLKNLGNLSLLWENICKLHVDTDTSESLAMTKLLYEKLVYL